MDNDKTRWVLRWASKGCESSWKPAGSSCTKREPQELTAAKTRQGTRRLPLSCLPIHRTRCRRTPFGSSYHRVLSSVLRASYQPRNKQTRNQLTEQRFLRALRRVHRSLESQPLPQIWTRNVGMARRSCRPQSTMSRREASLAFISISTCRARPGRAFPFGAAMRRAGLDPWLLEVHPGARLTHTL